VAAEVKRILTNQGVPPGKIVETTYTAGSSSPVLVSYIRTVAVTEECGSWDNLAATHANEPYDNFGCAHQNNIAAMVANPQDLVVPQPSTPADSGQLMIAVDKYRGYASSGSPASGGGSSSSSSGSSSSSSSSGSSSGSSGNDSGSSSGGDASSQSQ
jgi:pilus assembly protein CpaD